MDLIEVYRYIVDIVVDVVVQGAVLPLPGVNLHIYNTQICDIWLDQTVKAQGTSVRFCGFSHACLCRVPQVEYLAQTSTIK